jgi:hypothetical protein
MKLPILYCIFSCGILYNDVSSCTRKRRMVGRSMNWKWFRRKRSWLNRSTMPEFSWMDRGKPWETSDRILSARPQIRTELLLDADVWGYCYTIRLGVLCIFSDVTWTYRLPRLLKIIHLRDPPHQYPKDQQKSQFWTLLQALIRPFGDSRILSCFTASLHVQ